MRHFTSGIVNGLVMVSISPFRSCSANSITMKMESSEFPMTISVTPTTLGCCMESSMFASLSAVSGNPSRSLSIFTFFNALIAPVPLSRARNTTP